MVTSGCTLSPKEFGATLLCENIPGIALAMLRNVLSIFVACQRLVTHSGVLAVMMGVGTHQAEVLIISELLSS